MGSDGDRGPRRAAEDPVSESDLEIEQHEARTPDGWLLELRVARSPAHFAGGLPVAIVPGYGMNSFIFSFHPRGTSMERSLCEAGYEVWSLNLRSQGGSRRIRSDAGEPSLRVYAETDLSVAIDAVLERSATGAERVQLIGASLGGSLAYAHLALVPEHRIAGVVAVGSPLRWEALHPALAVAFRSPRLVGMLRFSGTRRMARAVLPIAARIPHALDVYMNASHVDLSRAREMTQTVEDPIPRVNRDIAKWISERDMVLAGTNVTEALRGSTLPLLCVLSNRDGIVPTPAAMSAASVWADSAVQVLTIGDEHNWYAHADLFVGDEAPARVFAPIASWLARQQG